MADVLGPLPAQPAKLDINAISTTGGTQMRALLDINTVGDYHAVMKAVGGWGPFPAVTIFHDGRDHWLGDGFHRVAAYRRLLADLAVDSAEVPADIRVGTRRDAVLHAAGANASHGLRRSQADKRRAVETLLRDDEWQQWSDREIARKCNVSPDLVGAVRRELAPPPPPPVTVGNDSETPAWVPPGISAPRTFITKHGTPATMQTAAIGKTQPTYAPVWRIEVKVKSEMETSWPGVEPSLDNVAELRRAAQTPGCAFIRRIETSLDEDGTEFRQQDIVRAITNVTNEIEQQLKRQSAPPLPVTIKRVLPGPQVPAGSADLYYEAWVRKTNKTCACGGELLISLHRQDTNPHGSIIDARLDVYCNSCGVRQTWIAKPMSGWQLITESTPDPAPAPAEPAADITPVSMRSDYDGDEWYTPDEIIRTASHVMGRIDTDPASCELAQTVVQAATYYTRHDSGLAQPWHGSVWLNPPYSAPQVWIDRLFAEMAAGRCQQAIVLVNNATETAWFQRLLAEAKLVCFPARRIAFWRHDHKDVGARQGQALFYFGPKADAFYSAFSATGAVLRRLK